MAKDIRPMPIGEIEHLVCCDRVIANFIVKRMVDEYEAVGSPYKTGISAPGLYFCQASFFALHLMFEFEFVT